MFQIPFNAYSQRESPETTSSKEKALLLYLDAIKADKNKVEQSNHFNPSWQIFKKPIKREAYWAMPRLFKHSWLGNQNVIMMASRKVNDGGDIGGVGIWLFSSLYLYSIGVTILHSSTNRDI
jgi:hypothetical protein